MTVSLSKIVIIEFQPRHFYWNLSGRHLLSADIASHWVKLADQSNGRNGINSLCSIDFWILVMLQNTKANRQSVHKVLKKKAATEVLSYEFVHLVLNGHGGALSVIVC